MPKFYVLSGELKVVIDRLNAEAAALDAIQTLESNPVRHLSRITVVSEHGFPDNPQDDDVIFTTLDILEEAGLLHQFKPKGWV
jgi:hypothetical protein